MNPRLFTLTGAVLLASSSSTAVETDREIAVWALHMGGFVVLEGDQRHIRDVTKLPSGDFRIEMRLRKVARFVAECGNHRTAIQAGDGHFGA